MKTLERHPEELEVRLVRSAKRDAALRQYLTEEVEDAISAGLDLEQRRTEWMRMYNARPRVAYRKVPIENAPNIEVPLGAIACDAICAQASELIYAVTPTLTCRATQSTEEAAKDGQALQKFVNWSIANEMGFRAAGDQALLDDVQLGTGVLYIPWIERWKKTDVARIHDVGPRMHAIPLEDFLVPGGSYAEVQEMAWCGHRSWLTDSDLVERKRRRKWRIDGFTPTAVQGWMRSRRESYAGSQQLNRKANLYEVFELYLHYDYDMDGEDEDLLVIFDRTSHTIGWVGYNPYDQRPYETGRYQLRPYLFPGMGVLEMLAPFQEEVTESHNDRAANIKLANTVCFLSQTGTMKKGQVMLFPGANVEVNNIDQVKPFPIGRVDSTGIQHESVTISLGEKRVGVNDLTTASRPSSILGSRTPGITALSFIQQQNRRFAPAFDGIRFMLAGAARQGMTRYRERLLAGDLAAEHNIVRAMGDEDGARVMAVLRDPGFYEATRIELTASSASVNRDVDKQNAMLLANFLGQYYQQVINLVMVAANPQTPQPVRDVAMKAEKAISALVERTMLAFDQMRDPDTFLIHYAEDMANLPPPQAQDDVSLRDFLGSLGVGGGGGGPEAGGGIGGAPSALPGLPNELPNSGGGIV